MRLTRVAQVSIFEDYSKHEFGQSLKRLSDLLDHHAEVLDLVKRDFADENIKDTGRNGLSIESIFRCLILKQQLRVSYEQLAFHLSDSVSYRTFARIMDGDSPSRSTLQSAIRTVKPATLEEIQNLLTKKWTLEGTINCERVRVDSSVIRSDIAAPNDSQLLCDGIRVLSRLLAKSREVTGVKVRFQDQRKRAKSLGFRIFNGKNAVKQELYPTLLHVAKVVKVQAERGLEKVELEGNHSTAQKKWQEEVRHYYALLLKVIDQTERRVILGEKVPSIEKIVSLFEPHTDLIIKGYRDVQYGHKVNLSTQSDGFITYFSIESGNPSDKELLKPVFDHHKAVIEKTPKAIVADGGYASKANAIQLREGGVKQIAFTKHVGLSYLEMGLKKKTHTVLSHFRAGVEGNISELKRAFGAAKARWKGKEGFEAYAWASVLSYNLIKMARLRPT